MRIGEFQLIELLKSKLPKPSKEVEVPIGDDTAVVNFKGEHILLTTDALVEGSHFKVKWKELVDELFFLLGKKLLNVCASDIASMGGEPKYALVNVGAPKETDEELIITFYDGLGQASRELKVNIIGGDTVKSKNLFIDMALIGLSKGYMLRSSAKPGDLIGVTGTFGDSRGGLELLLKGELKSHYLINKFLSPKARVEEGKGALKVGVRCCTDVSDGLLFNLKTIAESSKVKLSVDSSKIPISKELIDTFGKSKALDFALYGGEDYELIITFPEELMDNVEKLGFRIIGTVENGSGVYLDGKPINPRGFDHFKEV